MAQRVGWQKISANLVRPFLLYIYFTINSHTHIYIAIFMFIDSVIQIGFCILSFLHMCQPQLPAARRVHETMKDETLPAYRDTEFYTHDYLFLSLYIFYMPPYKLFSTARSYSLGLIKYIFYTTGYNLPLQFYTCISNLVFHKSTPVLIFLRFTFIQIQFCFYLLSSVLSNAT
jgi:heme/copper-type cytochrome/quinol oxidase subunit 4